jgi:phage/plasmid-associated DNA primase
MDNIAPFVDECCELEEGLTCETKKLYSIYSDWRKEAGLKPYGRTNFNKRIESAYKIYKKRLKGDTCERWIGITVKFEI